MKTSSRLNTTMQGLCGGVRKVFGSLGTAAVFLSAIYTVAALYAAGEYLRWYNKPQRENSQFTWVAAVTFHAVALANFFLIFGIIANKLSYLHAWLSVHVVAVMVMSVLWIWVPIVTPFHVSLVYLIGTPIVVAGVIIFVIIVYHLSLEMQYGPSPSIDAVTTPGNGWVSSAIGQQGGVVNKDTSELPAVFISSNNDNNSSGNGHTNVTQY